MNGIEEVRAQKADLEEARSVLEQERERLEQELAQRRQSERQRQIIRGHQASLGKVKPYITEVGPGGWGMIESWLALAAAPADGRAGPFGPWLVL